VSGTIEIVNRNQWRSFAPLFRDYNYRQLWDFGVACTERLGAVSEHVAIKDASEILGLADVRIKRVPLLKAGIAYITGGPLVRRQEEGSPESLKACLQSLINRYVRDQGLVLRVLGPLGTPDWNARQTEVFEALGFKTTTRVASYHTLVVDIARPPGEIRKGLAQKWRNCLNRAEKNGLEVRSGADLELFDDFCGLYRQLLDRKQFEVELDADFYARVQGQLIEAERFLVSLVDVQGEPVAGHVASILGDTCVYLLGASNHTGLETKASYLLQWHTIQSARERSCQYYDLGGIDPEQNPGVYHFKQGVGGTEFTAPGPFELKPRGTKGHLAMRAEGVYRFVSRRLATR